MPVSQAEEDRVLAAWYCNECYGKYFIAGMKHGVTSIINVDHIKNVEITITFVDEADKVVFEMPNKVIKRASVKRSKWEYEFFDPHGTAPNGPVDTSYVSYWGHLAGGQSCWGNRVPSDYSGEYSVSSSYENSQIYFADLRSNIIVYFHEAGSYQGNTSGTSAMGLGLAYAEFDGSPEASCKTVNTLDAIKMPIALQKSKTIREIITLGDYVSYNSSVYNTDTLNIAASDRSGYAGGVAYNTYAWGSYARIDQNEPFSCTDGYYTEEASPEALEDYLNSWDINGTFTNIDAYDASVFNANINGQGVNALPNGTYDYPSFINIDPLPKGSFATDAAGNYFHSMITRDMKTFNKLNTTDPDTAAELTGSGIVYYPIAPA